MSEIRLDLDDYEPSSLMIHLSDENILNLMTAIVSAGGMNPDYAKSHAKRLMDKKL